MRGTGSFHAKYPQMPFAQVVQSPERTMANHLTLQKEWDRAGVAVHFFPALVWGCTPQNLKFVYTERKNSTMSLNPAAFETFPVLTTERLLLRDIRPEDAEAIFHMRANQRVNRFIPRPAMAEPEKAADLVAQTRKAFNNREAIGWAGILRNGTEIIGTCGLTHLDHLNRRAELGGELATTYWGKHLAAEAVGAIVHYGFHTLHLHSIEAKVAPENRGAIAILESLGFQQEAHFKDRIYFNNRFLDMAVYTCFEPGSLNQKPQG